MDKIHIHINTHRHTMEIYYAFILLLVRGFRSHTFQKTYIALISLLILVSITRHAIFTFIITIIISLMLPYGVYVCMDVFWWKTGHYARIAKDQGIQGPKPTFLLGNALHVKRFRDQVAAGDKLCKELDPKGNHSYMCLNLSHNLTLQRILPEHVAWSHVYGVKRNYLMWFGPTPQIVTMDMEVVKDALLMPSTTLWHGNNNKNNHNHHNNNNVLSPSVIPTLTMGKPPFIHRLIEPLAGTNSIALVNGDTWAHKRRAVAPAFHSIRLKEFSQTMVNLTMALAESWSRNIEQQENQSGEIEIEMEKSMGDLTSNIIAHTQFGSSYKRSRKVLQYYEELRNCASEHAHLLMIPGMSYVPLPIFMKMRKLRRDVENSIGEMIGDRKSSVAQLHTKSTQASSYGFDLLGFLLSESDNFSIEQIVDDCKTFFFGGHETTTMLLTWALLLLAHNRHWQDKARSEVVGIYKENPSCFDSASKMKIVEMILYETLRLYPPGNVLFREALCDLKLGDLFVPKGMTIMIPIVAIHLDSELWGNTVHDFDPWRFKDGIRKASKHPMAFLPFAHGARNCIGQMFAMLQAKLVLGTLLSKFSFAPSPSYKHAPESRFTIVPKYGAPIIVQRIASH